MIAEGDSGRVMDHHERRGGHQNAGTGHSDDRRSGGCDAVNFDRHIALVIHQHGIDLASCDAVATGRIEPNNDVPGACEKLVPEHLRCDIIVKPRLFGNGAVKLKNPLRSFVCLVLPYPELLVLHWWVFPPFRCHRVLVYMQKLPRS